MDRSAVKAIVDREIEPMMARLGVPHWRVSVDYGPCSNPNWKASCGRTPDYNQATITIDASLADNEQDVIDSLEHELFHVLLAPFGLYRDLVTQHVAEGSAEEKQEARLFCFTIEQMVINLKRMRIGLAPAVSPATPKAKPKRKK